MNKKDKDTKESFCPACIAVPLAMAGTGASSVGMSDSNAYKKHKKILLWGGIITTAIAVVILIYYKYIKDCKACR